MLKLKLKYNNGTDAQEILDIEEITDKEETSIVDIHQETDATLNSPCEEFMIKEVIIDDTNENAESNAIDTVLNEISTLKSFQSTVEKKLFELEKALISQ